MDSLDNHLLPKLFVYVLEAIATDVVSFIGSHLLVEEFLVWNSSNTLMLGKGRVPILM